MDSSTRIHAPDFPAGLDWFNVAAPLSLKALRGKVVLLDFWTYGCINCLHVIPDLKRLEEKYGAELVVIGVHSAKFTNERQGENLRRILVRYDVDHPVVNDERFEIWRSYGARAWPTQVLIDPEGYVVGTASGEGNADAFDRAIGAVVHVFDEQGKIDRAPIALSPERERLTMGTLAFPGKVLADEAVGPSVRRRFQPSPRARLLARRQGARRGRLGRGRLGRRRIRGGAFLPAAGARAERRHPVRGGHGESRGPRDRSRGPARHDGRRHRPAGGVGRALAVPRSRPR